MIAAFCSKINVVIINLITVVIGFFGVAAKDREKAF